MSMLQNCQEDKTTALAFFQIGTELLQIHNIDCKKINLSMVSAQLGLNRTHIYEKKMQIEKAASQIVLAGKGRPSQPAGKNGPVGESLPSDKLTIEFFKHRLAHPGAYVINKSGRVTYSDGFKRFALDQLDRWEWTDEEFCSAASIPLPTLNVWRQMDAKEPFAPHRITIVTVSWPSEPNEVAREIAEDYQQWEGSLGDFLRHQAQKRAIAPSAIRSVLRICDLVGPGKRKLPRYRGSTAKLAPGTIAVTDGKDVKVSLTATGEQITLNWQGTVDQATACHTALVVTESENAAAVREAYDQTTEMLGRSPEMLLHDNKPIYQEEALRQHVEAGSTMIAATPATPENKAVIEGEFGKFEQQVGRIILDDSSKENFVRSATTEVIRGYVAGINHAGRAEFDGKSRLEMLRNACPEPERDKALIAQIKEGHQKGKAPVVPLPFTPISRKLLDTVFEEFNLLSHDESGRLRNWIASRFEPEAIRRASATFGGKYHAGALRGKHAERYLVKIIKSNQEEIDLGREMDALLRYAEIERNEWLINLDQTRAYLQEETLSVNEQILRIAEHCLFGSIFVERSYWEKHLIATLADCSHLFTSLINHIKRLYEASVHDRRRLIDRLIAWKHQLGPINDLVPQPDCYCS